MVAHDYLLTSVVAVPGGAALLVALLPRTRPALIRAVGLGAALAAAGLAFAIAVLFKPGVAGYQMVTNYSWIGAFGISWKLGVDGISLFLVLLCGILFPVALAFGQGRARASRAASPADGSPPPGAAADPKGFVAWMLLLESACLGSFLALDLFVFFVFFEVTLAPAYFIIGGWGGPRRAYAAVKFFLYTFFGSAFLLIGMLALVFIHERATGHLTFDLVALASHTPLAGSAGTWLFLAFTAAFAVKAPVFPLHTWSPDAYGESPAAGAVILAGVMAKLGTYGIIRFDFELFPRATVSLAPVLLTLAVIGIIYGAVVACRQRDLGRLVAYSSLSHMGFIVLGLFAFTSQGLSGGVLQMLNHGIYTAALFLLIGMIFERRLTSDVGELRGLQKGAPILAGVFTLVMMASIGLPGLNGFVGEFLILIGSFLTHRWWAIAAAGGVVVASVYLLWAYQQVFHGRPEGANTRITDLSWREGAILAPLVAVIIVMGVYPRPVLNRITPSVDSLIAHVEASTTYRESSVAKTGKVTVAAVHGAGSSRPAAAIAGPGGSR